MTIEIDNYRQQEPTNLLEKKCLDCPHLYSLERNAGSYRMNREVEAHRAICPGRRIQARKAVRSLGKRRIQSVRRGVVKRTHARRYQNSGYYPFYAI